MTDAVKMAALEPILNAIAKSGKVEAMDYHHVLAALEQDGEPVGAVRLEAVDAPGIVCSFCEGEGGRCEMCGGLGRLLPLPTLQRLGREFDAAPVKECLTTAADASLPQRKDCGCDCHNPGSTKLHIMPCCRNDEPAADAGVTQGDADKKLLAHIVSWVHCPAIMSVDQVEQMIAAHRLQSVAAATAGKDRRDPLRDIVFRYIDRMNDVAPECGDPADRILGEFARDVNAVLKAERAALSEARDAGDSLAAGDRV